MIYLKAAEIGHMLNKHEYTAQLWMRKGAIARPVKFRIGNLSRTLWRWRDIEEFCRERRPDLTEPKEMPRTLSLLEVCSFFSVLPGVIKKQANFPKAKDGVYGWQEIEEWIEKHAEAE